MEKRKRHLHGIWRLLVVCATTLFWTSCSEPLDTEQLNDLSLEPNLETSIFYVKTQESLINRVTGLRFFTQDFNFDAFEAPFFSDRVLEGSIRYELQNTTSKPISLTILFLDEAGAELDTEEFSMDATPTADLERTVAYGIGGKPLDILRNTTIIRITARNRGDNSSVSEIEDAAVILRSSGAFRFSLR